ncbi:MAG: demethoxyubiquinone hydroxylase family protein, partial [Armatimonadetes bacterium]|nr:demethoxyubiquinone hydroxylase family protein [Armatimonadota bacterium]
MEENDHLDWCEKRLEELDNRKSILNPFWYL